MKPPPFEYHSPVSIEETLALLAEHEDDAAVLAGGQSLMPMLNMRFARPQVLIDINPLAELDTIDVADDQITLGAMTRLRRIERDDAVGRVLPVLHAAIAHVAHPQIRSRTTLGGTMCHADPAAELPAVAVALDARLQLRNSRGTRTVTADDFFEATFLTAKEPDELLVDVAFPAYPGMTIRYDEVARRHGDFPFAGLCLGLRIDDGVVAEARAAAAGLAPRPVRLPSLEEAIVGHPPLDVVDMAAEAATSDVDPADDVHGSGAFREGLLRQLVRRLVNDTAEVAA